MRLLSLSTFAALSLIATGVVAQGTSASTSTSSARAAATFVVEVGKADHKFRPEVTQAEVGDVIEFQFFPPNHSVVRAEYLYPCVPYEKTNPGEAGFFSGFQPVSAVLNDPPKWRLIINDTEPIFFYCSAPGSCIDYQMVGAINPNASTLLANQKLFAENSTYMLQPGEDFPSESSSSTTTSSASSTSSTSSSPTTSSTATQASQTSSSDTSHKSSFPPGAIAGIVIGVVVIIALAAALFYFVGRMRSAKAQDAAVSILGGGGGQASPVVPPPEPVYGPGGMVYVPVKATDYNRMSSPSMYGSPVGERPQSYVTTQEMGMEQRSPTVPPVEMAVEKS